MVQELIDRRARVGGSRPQLFNAHLAREKYSIGIFPCGNMPPADWKGRPPSGRRSKRTALPPRPETAAPSFSHSAGSGFP